MITSIHYYSIIQNSFSVQEIPPSIPLEPVTSTDLLVVHAFFTHDSRLQDQHLWERLSWTCGKGNSWQKQAVAFRASAWNWNRSHPPTKLACQWEGAYTPPTGSYCHVAASGGVQFSYREQGNK